MTLPYDPPVRRHVLDDHTDPGLVDEVQRLNKVQAGFEARMDTLQEHTMHLDPKEFGRMQADIEGLRRDVDQMTDTMRQMVREMRELNLQMSEAKGGWKMLLLVGSIAGVAGGLLVKFLLWVSQAGPR